MALTETLHMRVKMVFKYQGMMTPRNCAWCDEPVLKGEQAEESVNAPMHRECLLRSVIGSVSHVLQLCSCYVKGSKCSGDEPGLSKRAAARIAVKVYRMPTD